VSVTLSPEALADLRSIRAFIAGDNPGAAARLGARLVAACDRLAAFPNRGRPGRVPGTRELASVHPYVIVYRVTSAGVEIIRIWHKAQSRG
jgi:toxin ParE1/3/4